MENRFEKFAITIAQLNRYVQKIKSMEMTELGLKGNHTMCLYYLGKNSKGITSAELCGLCKEDKAAVSRTLSELDDLELIVRDSSGEKRDYRSKLFLTEKGKEFFKKLCRKIDKALDLGGMGLSDELRKSFYSALEIIADNLRDITENQPTGERA